MPVPARQTSGSAGFDVAAGETVVLLPGERKLVRTGFAIAVPEGWECQVRPRSGLALKHGITLPNTPGTIDSDYRGEWKVIMRNCSKKTMVINEGDRVAQAVFRPTLQIAFTSVSELSESSRTGGFGSTGTKAL